MHELTRDTKREPRAQTPRQGSCDCPAWSGEAVDRPIGRVFARAIGHLCVGATFTSKETQHRGERRQPNPSRAQTRGAEPVLVELLPRRQQVDDALVQCRHENAPDAAVPHSLEF